MTEPDDLRALSSLLVADDAAEAARTRRIAAAVPDPPVLLRVALGVAAAVQGPIALGWFLNADLLGLLGDRATDVHLARDGALGLVIVAAAWVTVWRPRWASPAFVIAAIGLVAELVGSFADGRIASSPGNEAVHLLLVATTVLIGANGLRLRPLSPARRSPLRAVPPDGHGSAGD